MKKQTVQIRMRTLQSMEGQRERAEYEYRGNWMEREGRCYVTYQESIGSGADEEGTDEAGTDVSEDGVFRTLLTYTDASLELKRKGEFQQRMEFVPGNRTRALYETSMGSLPMEVHTKKLSLRAEEQQHFVELEYQLFSAGGKMGEYRMELEIFFLDET